MNVNPDKARNTRLVNMNLNGTKSQKRKKYKDIIKEMGERNITLQDLADNLKTPGMLEVLHDNDASLDTLVILSQFGQAICYGDTKAATFLRDTAGEAPKQQIEIDDDGNGLSKMSLNELLELKNLLEKQSDTV